MYLVRTPQCVGAGFRQAKPAHLSFAHEIAHGASYVLNGDAWIDTMLIEQIDDIDAKASQRVLANLADMIGPAVDAEWPTIRCAHEAELCGDHDAISDRSQAFAHEDFVLAVYFRCVEERHAKLDRAI